MKSGLARYGLALIGALAVVPAIPAKAVDVLSIAGDGGIYQDAERKAFYEPTAKALGIQIKDYSGTGLPAVRAQVKANAVTWDVAELWQGLCEQSQREGLTEKLDYSVIKTDGIPKGLYGDNWIAITSYSTVLAYNTNVYNGEKPKTWADFWDVKKFPGKRSMNSTGTSLEIALLADGVAPDKLFPLDIERGFKKLAELKPNIGAWWGTGAQAMQFAKNEEVDMLSIWSGRIAAVKEGGAPVDYSYNQGIMGIDCLVIPKGAPHKDLAQKVIASIVSPEIQANLPLYINYGPVNELAFKTGKISPELAAQLNTGPEHMKQQVIEDLAWWADHSQEVQERFDKLLQ